MASWYEQLGFRQYPLDPRSNTDLVGVEQIEKTIKGYILQGNMCLISGATGSGKTSMLKRISQSPEFSKYKFIYISADGVKKDFDVSDAIEQHKTFFQRLILSRPRNLVILLDECQLATRTLTESIKSQWNVVYPDGQRCIQSVVVCQIPDRLGTNFSGSFADRLGNRRVSMPRLSNPELREVLVRRLSVGSSQYVELFTPEALEFLISSARGSVRQLLEYTDAVFRSHDSFGERNPLLNEGYKISREMVFNALQQSSAIIDDGEVREVLHKIHDSSRLTGAIEMFTQFGALCDVDLAEKLDTSKQNAQAIIRELKKLDALVVSHEQEGSSYYVIAPRVAHEMIKE